MELTKQSKDLDFKWKDITIHVRSKATPEDVFEVKVLYEVDKKGAVKVPVRDVYKTLIERFVTGWTGVTEDGKPVPFSFENLGRLPLDHKDDIILRLGSFIFNNSGIFPTEKEAERKNG